MNSENTPAPDPPVRPVLRESARRRSLEAALAAVTPAAPHAKRSRRLAFHCAGWAACWLLTAFFMWSDPSEKTASKSAGPAMPPPVPDEETASLLAALYPNDVRPRLFLTFSH